MSRTGENIYKRKDGRWEARYIRSYASNGKAIYGYLYARTYAEVKTKLIGAKSACRIGRAEPSAHFFFCDVAEKWLQEVRMNCKVSTYNKYLNHYQMHVKSFFGNSPMEKIGAERIDAFLFGLAERALSHKTIQDICMIVKQIYSFAEKKFDVRPNFSPSRLRIKNEPEAVQTLTDEEVLTLCRYLLAEICSKKAGVLLCLFTGIRVGELCALRWGDFSLREGTLRISKSVQRLQKFDGSGEKTALVTTSPKSRSSNRTIPLPSDLLPLLRALKEEARTTDDAYFLSGSDRCFEPRVMEYNFKKYLEACGIRNIKFHALRHTFASRCIEVGFDAKTLSEILGHSSVNITLNRYVHTTMNMKKAAMEKLTLPSQTPSKF